MHIYIISFIIWSYINKKENSRCTRSLKNQFVNIAARVWVEKLWIGFFTWKTYVWLIVMGIIDCRFWNRQS